MTDDQAPTSLSPAQQRFMDELCRRAIERDMGSANFPDCGEGLKEYYRETAVDKFVTPGEWDALAKRVYSWRVNMREQMHEDIYPQIFGRFISFPKYSTVSAKLSVESGERYRMALEHIENSDAGVTLPIDYSRTAWTPKQLEERVYVVTQVIAPNIGDNIATYEAYASYSKRQRARTRVERVKGPVNHKRKRGIDA